MSVCSRSQSAPSKHGAYFEVLAALGRGSQALRYSYRASQDAAAPQPAGNGCPICHLNLRNVSRYLDALSYENVNDPGVRAALRAYRGFCNHHAWQFAEEIRDGLGTAIIYRDVVGNLLRLLQESPVSTLGRSLVSPVTGILEGRTHKQRGAGDSLIERLSPEGDCPACLSLAQSSWLYLDTLLVHRFDEEMRNRYLSSAGLCVPHLALAAARLPSLDGFEILAEPCLVRLSQTSEGNPGQVRADTSRATETLAGKCGGVLPVGRPETGEVQESEREVAREAIDSLGWEKASGCVICRLTSAALDGWLASLPAQVGREAELRNQLGQSRGLCNRHTWRLAEVSSYTLASGHWQPALAQVAEALRPAADARNVPASSLWSGLGSWLSSDARGRASAMASRLWPQAPCPACEYQAAVEEAALSRLLEGPVETELAASAEGGPTGLCLPHFLLALRLPMESTQWRATLVSSQISLWGDLYDDLDRYVYKHDYRFRDRPWGKEIDAPWRAIALMAGAKGVRGVANL